MEKLIITPETLADFADQNKPSLLTVSNNTVTFNRPAAKLLEIDDKFAFTFFIDNGKLFYKDHANGFKTHFTKSCHMANVPHILPFLKSKLPLNSTAKSIKFEIGEFKEGYRLLTPVK